jgi:hypothetical protein
MRKDISMKEKYDEVVEVVLAIKLSQIARIC